MDVNDSPDSSQGTPQNRMSMMVYPEKKCLFSNHPAWVVFVLDSIYILRSWRSFMGKGSKHPGLFMDVHHPLKMVRWLLTHPEGLLPTAQIQGGWIGRPAVDMTCVFQKKIIITILYPSWARATKINDSEITSSTNQIHRFLKSL